MNTESSSSALPYTDSKKVGSADFYFAINATFRFIEAKFGAQGLRRYWQDLGASYYTPVGTAWKRGGLPAIANYWRAFFDAEPDAEVEVSMTDANVVLEVRVCPAIKHLRAHGREILPSFCQHCYYVSQSIAAPAGFSVLVDGGNGSCRQTFQLQNHSPEQDLTRIREAK